MEVRSPQFPVVWHTSRWDRWGGPLGMTTDLLEYWQQNLCRPEQIKFKEIFLGHCKHCTFLLPSSLSQKGDSESLNVFRAKLLPTSYLTNILSAVQQTSKSSERAELLLLLTYLAWETHKGSKAKPILKIIFTKLKFSTIFRSQNTTV